MINRLQTLYWFLKRPRLYPQLIDLVSTKLSRTISMRDDSGQEMLHWCAERCVDTNTALEELTGMTAMTPVNSLFFDYFENAERIKRECPVEMGGPGDIDLLYWSAEHLKATRVIETGVAYGWSSLALLLSLRNRKDTKLISTDMPYPNRNNDAYVGCIVPEELKSDWHIIRYADRQALPKALAILDEIDMCHYDSDKRHEGRMWAYPLLWNALRPGGFLISDDIGDNVAFRTFSTIVGGNPIVVKTDGKYIGIIIKPLGM